LSLAFTGGQSQVTRSFGEDSTVRIKYLLIVGAIAVLGIGARGAVAAPAPVTPPQATVITGSQHADWEISGTLQSMNGQFWNVQGFAIRVVDTTTVSGGIPTIGENVSASGVVLPDGTWVAKRVTVGPTATASATGTPTPTTTPLATVTSTPVMTSTATATNTGVPTATSTVAASRTPKARGTPSADVDRDDRDDPDDRRDQPPPKVHDDRHPVPKPKAHPGHGHRPGSIQDDGPGDDD
jgi:hypothetical protein